MRGMLAVPKADLKRLLPTLPPRWRALTALGVLTGCRISELLMLKWRGLYDPATGELRSRIQVPVLKKRSREPEYRQIELLPNIRQYIEPYLREREYCVGREEYVFPGRVEGHLSRITAWRFYRRLLGERHGTHWMRKTFAKEVYRMFSEVKPDDTLYAVEQTREMLRHARIDTTIKYLGIDYAMQDEAHQRALGDI